MGSASKLPWNDDARGGYAWYCPDCPYLATLGGNAAYHAVTVGHSPPEQRPWKPEPDRGATFNARLRQEGAKAERSRQEPEKQPLPKRIRITGSTGSFQREAASRRSGCAGRGSCSPTNSTQKPTGRSWTRKPRAWPTLIAGLLRQLRRSRTKKSFRFSVNPPQAPRPGLKQERPVYETGREEMKMRSMQKVWMVALLCCCIGMAAAAPASAGCNEGCVACNVGQLSLMRCANMGYETGMSCGGPHACGENGRMDCDDTLCGTPAFMQPAESQNSTPAEIVARGCPAPVLMTAQE